MTSSLDVFKNEIIFRLKVISFLMAVFNILFIGLAGYSAIVWGFNALLAVFLCGFTVNFAVFLLVVRGKSFDETRLLDERID